MEMDGGGGGRQQQKKRVIRLKAIDATPANFKDYGQVVGASPDGALYGPLDAQLQLNLGTPRFYIMNLTGRALRFNSITHHGSVTQCLGSVGGQQWYLGVARASIVERNESECYKSDVIQDAAKDNDGIDNSDESMKQFQQGKILRSKAGHYYIPPAPEDVEVFRVQGSQFLKLNVGTWHAGPLFKEASMDFYNLELSDTNQFQQGGILRSKAGHYYIPPAPEDVEVFRVQGSQFLKLNVGTWHAGPLFKEASLDFYNLELSDTNEVDHTTHVFSEKDGVGFVIEE